MIRRRAWRPFAAALTLPASGCSGWQSALHAHGANARISLDLIWLFTIVCSVVWVLVMLVLAAALLRRRSRAEIAVPPLETDPTREQRFTQIVAGAVTATVLVIAGLTITSYLAGRSIAAMTGTEELTVRLTGRQWWWEVRYEDPQPSRTFSTANEIHVPIGVPVKVKLDSNDVIHSLWVPSLAGKRDLIPGRPSEITLVADRPGIYRGQCAEFCGYQHAHMAIAIVAESREAFDAWREAQLADAAQPADAMERRGRDVFLSRGCVLCHTIRGTPAGGKVGPDLTHVAGRHSIAAGTLPMTIAALSGWIADPQTIKPGTKMPRVELGAGDLNAVAAYVGSLK